LLSTQGHELQKLSKARKLLDDEDPNIVSVACSPAAQSFLRQPQMTMSGMWASRDGEEGSQTSGEFVKAYSRGRFHLDTFGFPDWHEEGSAHMSDGFLHAVFQRGTQFTRVVAGDKPYPVHVTLLEDGLTLTCCDLRKQLIIEQGVQELSRGIKFVAGTVINATVPTLFKVGKH
tara:strand:- start:583 stop:1104 length:522 start_codon:yes stop_codon:yes gene_type:complete